MKYRQFGQLEWKVSALGFGAMRLPIIGNDRSQINEVEAIPMMRAAFDHGINYVDTAYLYHKGNSEIVVGKALKDGYRETVRLATKMPVRMLRERKDLDTIFREQLKKLQTDYIDFYLFHGLNRERWQKMLEFDALDWAETTIAEGHIHYLGFSFHDDYKAFKEIVDGYTGWTLCQIHYNYVDTEYQAGIQGLKYAASQKLAVVIMEPLQGGNLVVHPPDEVRALWDDVNTNRTLAEWGLQWLWNQPEVSVVLSGMSTMNQVIENIESADRSKPGALTETDVQLMARIRKKYLEYGFIGCTGCRYCLPCTQGVAIPEILSMYNKYFGTRNHPFQQHRIIETYAERIPLENQTMHCIQCGDCEEKCPQQLPIRRLLQQAARSLERDR